MEYSINDILQLWHAPKDLAEDVGIKVKAVYKWPGRRGEKGSIPPKHDLALLAGAARRGLALTADDLMKARARG